MLPDFFLAVGKINKYIEFLSNKIKILQSLQQELRNDLFSGVQACTEINTIQQSIELLLYTEIPRNIEAIKLKYSYKGEQYLYLKHLGNNLKNILLKYLQVSKDLYTSIPDKATTEYNYIPEYRIEQLQIALCLR
jgi:hypothetical protein